MKYIPSLKNILNQKSRIRTTLLTFVILLFIYSLLRVSFLFINFDFFRENSIKEIFYAFLIGIRFDISAILLLNIPVIFLYSLPIKFSDKKFIYKIFFIIFCFLNLIGITLNIADLGYFNTIQRRLTFEPFTAIEDTFRMIPSLFKNYSHLIIAFLISVVLFIYFFKKIFNKIGYTDSNYSFKKSILHFIILILLTVIGIRGGLQLKPIRQTNAFFNDKRQLGYLALNSTYTVLRSYFQYNLPEYNFYKKEEIKNEIQKLIYSNDEISLDDNYIFLRKKVSKNITQKKNVIIFIMESWSAQYIGSITGGKTFTPFFDSLANKGILFTNFLASGQRSIEAVPSILASLPSIFPSSFIGSRVEINRIRGLGSILKEYGYTTSFHHGASHGSMGFDGFVPSAGFDLYFGKEDFENYNDSLFDGTWGIYDEPFFLDAAKKISKFNQPFCSVIFSLSSHEPFNIPEDIKIKFKNFHDENDYQKALRYSDYALQKFFEYAKKQKWFSNTIFLITADHTLYTSRNDIFSSFNVPLLIYQPDVNVVQKNPKVGSHVDILPTILDLLSINTIHSSMGNSLLDDTKTGFAVTTFYPSFLIFNNNDLYVDDFDKKKQYFENFRQTSSEFNVFDKNNIRIVELEKKLKSYVQAVTNSVNHDLIYKKLPK
ncbi:MAG: sulfatase-like hydrolase/transferase [Melioribacteraceae bacterium]|nr:sulfatase-like hydrolase/transferase [Melioribacteraceae bacterium]